MKRMISFGRCVLGLMILHGLLSSIAPQYLKSQPVAERSSGRLIPATTSMVTAWDIPSDPENDSTLTGSTLGNMIRKGFKLFMQTPVEAPRFTSNKLSCGNCHLNGGQRELALPLVGVARVYPEYNKREGRDFTLEDRIVGCFMRSENAPGIQPSGRDTGRIKKHAPTYPDPGSDEVNALAAYITWLSRDVPAGEKLPWRGHNVISPDNYLPMDKLDPVHGKELYQKNCSACHGPDGQGVQIGDKKAGPLWGPRSWNDGAGAARIYTLAGFIRYAMPYLNPGSLTDQEAQHIAAFINSMPRPEYPFKDRDYRVTKVPPDAVYYLKKKR